MRLKNYAKHDVVTIDELATVSRAAALMRERHVGDVVVVRGRENRMIPIGIITDRDIAIEVVGLGLDPSRTKVCEVMSEPVVCVNVDDHLTDALHTMSERGVRRAAVVDDHGILQAIVALDDLIGVVNAELARVTRLIRREREHEIAELDMR